MIAEGDGEDDGFAHRGPGRALEGEKVLQRPALAGASVLKEMAAEPLKDVNTSTDVTKGS
jgi:hypothetical protein